MQMMKTGQKEASRAGQVDEPSRVVFSLTACSLGDSGV